MVSCSKDNYGAQTTLLSILQWWCFCVQRQFIALHMSGYSE